jgi:hypothetical protein
VNQARFAEDHPEDFSELLETLVTYGGVLDETDEALGKVFELVSNLTTVSQS